MAWSQNTVSQNISEHLSQVFTYQATSGYLLKLKKHTANAFARNTQKGIHTQILVDLDTLEYGATFI